MKKQLLTFVLFCSSGFTPFEAISQSNQPVNSKSLAVLARNNVPELICESTKSKVTRRDSSSSDDPLVIPDLEVVEFEKSELEEDDLKPKPPAQVSSTKLKTNLFQPQPPDQPFRMAIWGDSHMAAAFFSSELIRLLGLKPESVQSAFVPANMNRGGVRLPVRKTCVSSGWRYESAHASSDAAQAPGPAMVNLFSAEQNANLSWDLRSATGQPKHTKLKFLFQQTASPIRVALSVDGADEQELILNGPVGPSTIDLQGDAPLSVIKIRLIEGALRVHGMALDVLDTTKLQFDLFGYPGATVAGWKQSDISYFKNWFTDHKYQLVVLAYGTNEGNNKQFDSFAYRQMLTQSVKQMKSVFPNSSCLLVGPGDRGILIRRSSAQKVKSSAAAKKNKKNSHHSSHQKITSSQAHTKTKVKNTHLAHVPNLFVYSHIHQQINEIQKDVAEQNGCQAWSMFDAMGGLTSAYAWANMRPQLMASDLIHFTVAGYERLAQKMAQDINWRNELIWFSR